MQSLPTFDLVLFGGTGDLALRKLLPALYRRLLAGQLTSASRITGVARSELTQDEYLQQVEASCRSHLGEEFDAKLWERFASQLRYLKIDAHEDADFAALRESLQGREANVRAFFLLYGDRKSVV